MACDLEEKVEHSCFDLHACTSSLSQNIHEILTAGCELRAERNYLEDEADEYGSIVGPWSNAGSVCAERWNLHLAIVAGKQRNEQVMMNKEWSSRSAGRDSPCFRPAATANNVVVGW